MSNHEHGHDEGIQFLVNDETYTTTDRKLTPRQILGLAGLTPAEDYKLIWVDGNKELRALDDEEPIHPGERFTAVFRGETPVS